MTPSTTPSKSSKVKKLLYSLLSAIFWIALWALMAHLVGLEILVPSPAVTFKRLSELVVSLPFWQSTGASLLRITLGYLAGVITATLLAIPSAYLPSANALIAFPQAIVRATPVASFILLALVWINTDVIPAFIAFLMVLPMIWSALKTAIGEVNPALIEMAHSYRIPFSKRFTYLYLPSILPSYLTALSTSLGFAWKSGIAAEVLCRPKFAMGSELYDSKIYLETVDLFAWTIAVVILSMAMDFFIKLAVRKVIGKGGKPA